MVASNLRGKVRRIIPAIENEFAIRIPDEQAEKIGCVDDVLQHIRDRTANSPA